MGNAKATKLYRERQSGKVDSLRSCPQCGKQVRTNAHDGLCSCWYKTTEGKKNTAERTRKCRQKKKNC